MYFNFHSFINFSNLKYKCNQLCYWKLIDQFMPINNENLVLSFSYSTFVYVLYLNQTEVNITIPTLRLKKLALGQMKFFAHGQSN